MREAAPRTILFHSEVSDPRWPARIQHALPEFRVVRNLDGVAARDVAAAVVWKYPAGMLEPLWSLRLIQVLGAGVDHVLADTRLPRGVPIARLLDPALVARMKEYVVMQTLALHRRSHETASLQREQRWQYVHPTPPEQCCVGIMGLGALGLACATALSALGFDVIGWSRSRKDSASIETYAGLEELSAFRRRCDIVVVLLPLTAATRDLIDRAFLEDLSEGAALVNVARGALVVDDDLIAALDQGRLRHAVLDVFRQEPLPAGHPFWRHPRITITPHNSSATNPETALDQVIGNIRRAMSGAPPLNIVDPVVGY